MLTIKHAMDANKDYLLSQQNNLLFIFCSIKTILLS